ncbi:MAG TPA: 50S ribosomal protein L24 [Candidatus Babeliaceae bacterium]|nr:50S ribosomal protein L24 [Candidatus Babeliaceae bacterium]
MIHGKKNIKVNDRVVVLTGKDRGHQGLVLDILPKEGKILVKGIAIVTRHVKKRREGESSGVKRQESYIDISNVMPICHACNKPSRSKVIVSSEGVASRACNRCNNIR